MADGTGPILAGAAAPNTVVGFAGFGGLCDALKAVTGREPGLAMNHWDVAIFVHQKLFPATEHFRGDIFDMNPLSWRPGEPIRFGWFSPDCTDHSKAKGGVPKTERIRGLAWSVIPWAKLRQVQTIMLENVEEWWDWGPIYRCAEDWRADGVPGIAGHPIKALRGVTRKAWVRRMNQAGYWVEKRELVTANYGVPTTRKRLYVICEYVGAGRLARIALGLEASPIRWAPPTHASRKTAVKKGLKPWVGFDTCADWSEPCPSIFLTPAEVKQLRETTGRSVKRPLVAATLKRVARGLDRYVISSADPFIVPITHQGDSRAHDVRDPLRTVTSVKGGEFALVAPTLASLAHGEFDERAGGRGRALGDPLNTISASGDAALAAATLIRTDMHQSNAGCFYDPTDPLKTITSAGGHAVVSATVVGVGGRRGQSPPRDVQEPMATMTGKPDAALVSAHLVRQFGTSNAADVEEPVGTIMADGGGKTQLVAAHLGSYYGAQHGSDPADPMLTATGKDRHALTMAWLEQANTGMVGHAMGEPISTIVGGSAGNGWGTTQRLIEARLELDGGAIGRRAQVLAFLWAHFGTPTPAEWAEPTATLAARRKFGLVILPRNLPRAAAGGGPLADPGAQPGEERAVEGASLSHCASLAHSTLGSSPGPRPGSADGPPPAVAAATGEVWMIVDIGLRMLLAKELARATGLSDDHDMSTDCHGRPVSKTHQTMGIGNMVPREPAASLIRTQCPDMIRTPQERQAA